MTSGEISPAVLFYNRQNRMPGLLTRYDLLVLDEAQSIRFSKADEIQAQLKGYLEQGVYTRGDCCATAECGLMLLANIELQQQADRRYHSGKPMFAPARADYIRRLPDTFLESPLATARSRLREVVAKHPFHRHRPAGTKGQRTPGSGQTSAPPTRGRWGRLQFQFWRRAGKALALVSADPDGA